MGILALVLSYEYTLFFIFQAVLGLNEGGMGLKAFSTGIFAVVLVVFFATLIKKRKIIYFTPVLFAIIILMLFIMTGVKFGFEGYYKSYLLSFGVRCIPAVLLGSIIVDNEKNFDRILKWAQPFMLLYSVGVILAVSGATASKYIQHKYGVGGMNYQTLSYCAAFAFNINLYIVAMWKEIPKFRFFSLSIWKEINIILLFIQIYCMFSAGGRGAVANVFVCIMFIFYIKGELHFKIKHVVPMICLIIVAVVVIGLLAKSENAGALRLSSFFGDSKNLLENERTQLRRQALQVFINSYLGGYGIGSIFFKMRLYSHNMFTDILAEGGLIGIITVIIVLSKVFAGIKTIYKLDKARMFVYIIFLSSFTMLMFSGYYLADGGLWFASTYILCSVKSYNKGDGTNNGEKYRKCYHTGLQC